MTLFTKYVNMYLVRFEIYFVERGAIMGVRIDELISLPELRGLKLVAGNKGIFKIVRWVHSSETPDLIRYVQSDELIMITGIGVSGNDLKFVELVNGLIEKKAAGLIVNTGRYLTVVPEEIKKIADENNFPIFEIPWETRLAEITRIICSNIVKKHLEEMSSQDLLKNIILINKVTHEEFMEKVSNYGYSYLNSFRIIIVTIDKFEEYLSSKNIKDEQRVIRIKDDFLRVINSVISDSRCRPISFIQNDSVVLLLINEKDKLTNLTMLSETIKKSSKNSLPDINVNIGIGGIYTEFSGIKRSYIEAEKALKVLKGEDRSGETIFYSNIGAYKLLTEIENMGLIKEYYDDTVGKLEQYDAQNETDFVNIFYIFLRENGNYIQTAQKLYMHRNTLMYKINKIREIIKRDLTDTDVRTEFYLGYLIKQINDF